jgi:hypothetical protein
MRIRLDVENLLLASWETSRESVERVALPGMQPAEVDGRHVVSVVSFRVRRGRVGRSPVLPFSQLNVRTYVTWKDEPAVLFLASRVTPAGLPGLLFGAPYRSARLRVRPGRLRAPGLGVDIRYRPDGPADPGDLGRHELGIFESGGLKAIRVQRGPYGVDVALRAAVERLLEGPPAPELTRHSAVDRPDGDGGLRSAEWAGLAGHPRISRSRSAR